MTILKCLLGFIAVLMFVFFGRSGFAQRPARQEPDRPVNAAERAQVIENVLAVLNESYVFPEVAKQMEAALRARVAGKEYDSISSSAEFAKTLTAHLQAVSHDKHLRLRYRFDVLPQPEPEAAAARPTGAPDAREREEQLMNYGFQKVERMLGNVGYLDLRHFAPPERCAETVAAALTFLAHTDALILDLRQNGGGDPAGVQLVCSYLFGPEPVHLNDLYFRPDDRTEEFWTLKSVAGPRYLDREVYVLTSAYTFSGAEECAYNLKNLKRATLVGETTGGGANPGGMERVGDHFALFVPSGRAINPITKTNWEGTGVTPDVAVGEGVALKTAHVLALEKLIPKIADPDRRADCERALGDLKRELAAAGSAR